MIEDCACGHEGHPHTHREEDCREQGWCSAHAPVAGGCKSRACGCTQYRPAGQAQKPAVEIVVQGIVFSEQGCDLQWMVLPDDVRSQSHVLHSRQTMVHSKAPEGLGALVKAANDAADALARRLYELSDSLPVYVPEVEPAEGSRPSLADADDDDDDRGMGE